MSSDPGDRPTSRVAHGAEPAPRADPYSVSLRQELQRLYLEHGAKLPLMGLLVIGVLGWVLAGHVPASQMQGWLALLALTLLVRWGLCVMFTRTDVDRARLEQRTRIVLALRMFGGACMGAGAIIWFPDLPDWERTVFSMACLGWYATTVIASLASPYSALLFGVALIGPIAVAWAMPGGFSGVFVATFMIVLLLLVRQATDQAHATVRAAIRSRLREEDLARRLERHGVELEAAMRAKSQFLAAASHDLRQPVTSMNLLLSAMAASHDPASIRAVATKLAAPVEALEEILSSILEVSRLEAGIIEVNRRLCTTGEVIGPVLTEYRSRAADKGIRLEAQVSELRLQTDPELLRRALRNLLDNAIKFTDVGRIAVEFRRDGDALVMAVADTGRGIAPEQQTRIFEDYYQGENPHRDRRQGLGLGLAIVRRLVGMLGGEISLESVVGRGSRFELRFPGAADPHLPRGEPGPGRSRSPERLRVARVLVVEDDRLVVDALSTLFGALGIDARYALDGEDALMQTALGRFLPDIALVDYGLPGEIDGISLIRQLRLRMPRCVFLLVTGDTRPEVMRRAADAGIATLHKPVSVEKLNQKLDELGVGT